MAGPLRVGPLDLERLRLGGGLTRRAPPHTLRVGWAAPFGNGRPVTSYTLSRSGAADVTVAESGAAPQFTVVGLLPGTDHTFSVAAHNALGAGPGSMSASFATDAGVPGTPPAPVALVPREAQRV